MEEGNSLEIILEIDPKNSNLVEINVLRSSKKDEYTRIIFLKIEEIAIDFEFQIEQLYIQILRFKNIPQKQESVVSMTHPFHRLETALSRPPNQLQFI